MFACMAQLVLAGQFNPEEATRGIGLKPTGVRQRGDFIKGSFAQREVDEWIISTGERRVGLCEDALYDLFSLVSPHAKALHLTAQLLGCDITLRLFVMPEPGQEEAVLELSPDMLNRIEKLGATLQIHLQRVPDTAGQ